MARNFTPSEYFEVDSSPVLSYPFTLACWFNSNSDTTAQTAVFVGDKDVVSDFACILIHGDIAGDPVRAFIQDSGADVGNAFTSTGFTAGTWHSAVAVFAAADDMAVYIDGGSKGVDDGSTPDSDPATFDRVSIGRLGDSTPGVHMRGGLAEVAIWNVALTDAEAASHGAGYSAKLIRPSGLVLYAPMVRDAEAATLDIVGGLSLTETGTIEASAHPPIIYPSPVQLTGKAAVAAGGIVVLRRRRTG